MSLLNTRKKFLSPKCLDIKLFSAAWPEGTTLKFNKYSFRPHVGMYEKLKFTGTGSMLTSILLPGSGS